MQVLVNGYGAYLGGIVRVHNSVCRALVARADVAVANAPRDQEDLPLRVISAQTDSRLRSLLSDAVAALRFERYGLRIDSAPAFRLFTRARRHVVIVHDLNFLRPAVHRISWTQRLYRHVLHRWSLWRVDRIVVNSAQTLAELNEFMPAATEKTVVLPLPVDHLPEAAAPAAAPSSRGVTRLMTYGHARNKGVDTLLAALRLRPDLHLSVVCPKATWVRLWDKMAEELEVRDRVSVMSELTDDELVAAYMETDVFCMLSTYEGYGIPVAEALFLERPTVVSALPVLRETSRGFATIAVDHNAESVVAAIERALGEAPGHWRAAAAAMRGWSWNDWVDELLDGMT